mmetsp:Transcript_74220/g.135529  ORF Transcript_74220/g.135529 Transcript_74220/m.135529 type:complete len:844 (-) Transcript_74220:154-2685(-)
MDLRFFFVLASIALGSGLNPGMSIWVNIIMKSGIGNSFCTEGVQQCDKQALMISNQLTLASQLGRDGDTAGALAFQYIGGRIVALVCSAMLVCGWTGLLISDISHHLGNDSQTKWSLLLFGIMLGDASGGMKYALYEFMYLFPGREGMVMTMANASFQCGAFEAMIINLVLNWMVYSPSCGWDYVIIFQIVANTVAGTLIFVNVPNNNADFEGQISDPNNEPEQPKQMFRMLLNVAWPNLFSHMSTVIIVATAPVWCVLFANNISLYGKTLFGTTADGESLASCVVFLRFLLNCLVGPCVAYIVEPIFIVFVLCACQWVATFVITFPIWLGQLFVAFLSAAMWALEPIVISKHLFSYFDKTIIGTSLFCFQYAYGALSIIAITLELNILYANQSHMGYAFVVLCGYGATMWTAYLMMVVIQGGYPKHCVIPAETEKKMCSQFACEKFHDIAELLHCRDEVIIDILTKTHMNPEIHGEIIQCIDLQRMRMQLQKHSQHELQTCFTKQILFWRQHVTNKSIHISFPKTQIMQHMGATARFGKQSLQALEKEITDQKSILRFDDVTGSQIRTAEVVLVQIGISIHMSKYFLVDVGCNTHCNLLKPTCRWPGTKKRTYESVQDATYRFIEQIGMNKEKILVMSEIDRQLETMQSPSYPGLITQYVKHVVAVTIEPNHDLPISSRILLSRNVHRPDNDKKTKTYEWLSVEECEHLQRGFFTGVPSTSRSGAKQFNQQAASKNLVGKFLTSRITRSLRKRDCKSFKHIINTTDRSQIVQALSCMPHWVGIKLNWYAEKLYKMMQNLVKHEGISSESIVIEIILLDILCKKRSFKNGKGMDSVGTSAVGF